ncbi:MAG TPA: MMPL family transporter, partial [Gaiellaceae bacterium]|nr:MMPL family transporter [Gaiellaceae bacterium]
MGVTERLGRASSRHPWRAILAWVGAIVVALALAATLLPGNLTTEGHVTGSPESTRAERLFFSRFPPDKNAVDELVVVRSATLTAREPAFRQFGARLLAQARATGVVFRERVLAVSKDDHAVLIGIQRKADVDNLLPVIERADGQDGFQVAMTGEGTLDHDFNEVSQHDLESGELKFGLPAALIILLLVFGAVVAGVIPLGMAFVAIVVALGLCAPIAAAFSLSVFFVNMLTG